MTGLIIDFTRGYAGQLCMNLVSSACMIHQRYALFLNCIDSLTPLSIKLTMAEAFNLIIMKRYSRNRGGNLWPNVKASFSMVTACFFEDLDAVSVFAGNISQHATPLHMECIA